MKQYALLFALLLSLCRPGYGQGSKGSALPPTAALRGFFDQPAVVLPRLYRAAIAHSGDINRYDAAYEVAQADVKLAKKRILNVFGLNSSYNYGTLPYFASAEGATPIYQINPFSLGARAQYSVGVGIVAPLDVLASRKTTIHRQELVAEQVVGQRHALEQQLQQYVIEQYQAMSLARTMMLHYQEALQTAGISRQITDKRFQQGELQLDEQLAATEAQGKVLLAYEETRARYLTAELLLENLIGAPITTISLAP